jgi:hypothetical protein
VGALGIALIVLGVLVLLAGLAAVFTLHGCIRWRRGQANRGMSDLRAFHLLKMWPHRYIALVPVGHNTLVRFEVGEGCREIVGAYSSEPGRGFLNRSEGGCGNLRQVDPLRRLVEPLEQPASVDAASRMTSVSAGRECGFVAMPFRTTPFF